jgi:hypothetical protein
MKSVFQEDDATYGLYVGSDSIVRFEVKSGRVIIINISEYVI